MLATCVKCIPIFLFDPTQAQRLIEAAARMTVLQEHLGLDRRTLERWRAWWLQDFAPGRRWQATRGLLIPPPDEANLTWSLWRCFGEAGGMPLLKLLRFLTPWTTPAVTTPTSSLRSSTPAAPGN